jgi:two-component system sensor histidine kinase KdpD
LVIKHGPTSEQHVDVDQTTYHQDNPLKNANGNGAKASAARVYEGKHGLPVIYEEAAQEPKKQVKSETNTISVLWHELISPLTLIKGYTATLLQLNDAITEEQKEQYLRGIDTASNRVIRLLENLRDITRLEETDSINFLRISLPDVLRLVASEMQNQTTKHVIKIRPVERLPLVKADPEKIEMVISNLLVNAVKYSPQGGDIEVETRLIRTEQDLHRMYEDAPMVKLPCLIMSIADAGVGIPESELDQIFEKFYRVKNKLTQTTPGAGLGLHICNIIIKAHNGHIWARNRAQGGSVFHFSLPLE